MSSTAGRFETNAVSSLAPIGGVRIGDSLIPASESELATES